MSQIGPQIDEPSLVDGEFYLTAADFRRLATILEAEAGIVLHEAKATLLYSRLAKRLRALNLYRFRDYIEIIEGPDGTAELSRMIQALTTNVTKFYREPHHFKHLAEVALPQILRVVERGAPLRIWSAACSTGEEPYSIALTVLSVLPSASSLDVKILATDIDASVLETASQGIYGAEALSPVPGDLRTRYFEPSERGYRAGAALRSMLVFKRLNLVQPWPLRRGFDVIFCRNAVIYFRDTTQADIWRRFSELLPPDRHLYVGHSERITGPAAQRFAACGITTYRRIAA